MKQLRIIMGVLLSSYIASGHLQAIHLSYHLLADQFHILDHLSASVPEFFLIPDYKIAWKKRFGLSQADTQLLNQYQKLRKKYQSSDCFLKTSPLALPSGLFAPHPDEVSDPIANAFYICDTYEQALGQLSDTLSTEELLCIKKTFETFKEKATVLLSHDKNRIQQLLDYFNQELARTKAILYLDQVRNFYQAQPRPLKSILLFWRPSGNGFSAACMGDHLQIITPFETLPLQDTQLMHFLTSVIVHEAIHHISGCACNSQKKQFTDCFFSHTKGITSPHFLYLLEEPLVMAHQMCFVKQAYPDFDIKASGYFDQPLAHRFYLMVKQYHETNSTIDDTFITQCAQIHNEPFIRLKSWTCVVYMWTTNMFKECIALFNSALIQS